MHLACQYRPEDFQVVLVDPHGTSDPEAETDDDHYTYT